ncbi:SNF2-related protein [Streptomyces sp. NPDC086843]|uniref:SNF2-related protein n=1 Tax=Streptomyces sp. NPDC086843 TaxID=3365763 RepID=UPI003828D667
MEWMTPQQAAPLARCAAVFEPGDPARTGRIAFFDPAGDPPPHVPGGEPGVADLVLPHGGGLTVRTLPVLRLTPARALPVLLQAHRTATTPPPAAPAGGDGGGGRPHPAAAYWGAVLALALHLTARERLLPGVSPAGYDTWRAGPFDAADIARLRALQQAAPGEAVAVPGSDPAVLVRAFLDAVADTLPRTPAARLAAGRQAFAAPEPQHVPHLRAWAEEISAGLDSGLRMSLRVELTTGPPDTPHPHPGSHPRPGPGSGSGPGPGPGPGSGSAERGRDGGPRPRLVPRAHSLADPTLAADADELFARADHALGPRAQADMVSAVRRAASVWPALERLLPVPHALDLTDGELRELLDGAAGRLAGHGIDVTWPETHAGTLTARAVAGADREPPADLRSFFTGDGTVDLRWRLELDGEPLTGQEAAAVADAGAVVRLRGRWILVGADLARKARRRRLPPLTAIEALAVALTGCTDIGAERVRVAPTPWLDALRHALTAPHPGPAGQPARLAATLRDYQLRGVHWMDRMTSLGLGGCLADDMGLGKTVQLIALHLLRQERPAERGPTLVVCPASLLGNWEREVERFAPGTPVRRHHGPARTLTGADDGFVLTTYGTMRLDAPRLAAHPWGLVVADEAQHVKNARSSTAAALRLIGARARIALTGTPVENNLSELWALLDWTTPGLLGTHHHFRTRWIAPIDTERARTTTEEAGEHQPTARLLSQLVRPFLLRRRKSDPGIAPELPPKTETDQPAALTAEQEALYRGQVKTVMAEIEAAAGRGIARSGLVLKLLTGLKQICNHPAQFLKEGNDAALAGRSGKLELLDELLAAITAGGGAALVFTQYVTMARLLERHLRERGIPAGLLHGGTPVARREELVRRFQDGQFPVFLLSLKAAGTGLNLTRADHVVHYDRWWNPAVEAQATDRAHRIGQTRPVQVHRLIAEGTVEDRIAALLEAKKELADAVLGTGEQALTELTNEELAHLVELRSTT